MEETLPKCSVCLLTEQDNVCYGEFIQKSGINVHYFCLLSGNTIEQNGTDSKGIFGFKIPDIIKSFNNYRNDICCYCKKPSAPIHCSEPCCYKKFHFICGFKNNCVTEFVDNFESYCHEHVLIANNINHQPEDLCAICYDLMGEDNPVSSVVPSCCDKHYIHRKCMMKYTLEAGFYTMCPLCDLTEPESFRREMRLKGIYIPLREASWETEENFGSQVKNKCNIVGCKNRRKEVYTCIVCGCFPVHLKCAGVSKHEDYYCSKCHDKTFLSCFKKPKLSK